MAEAAAPGGVYRRAQDNALVNAEGVVREDGEELASKQEEEKSEALAKQLATDANAPTNVLAQKLAQLLAGAPQAHPTPTPHDKAHPGGKGKPAAVKVEG